MRNRKIFALSLLLTVPTILLFLIGAGCTSFKRNAYEGFGFSDRQQDEILESLAIKPGDNIADLGAGGGYFTFLLAKITGPTGKVYAIDIDQGMIDYIKEEVQNKEFHNIETILAQRDGPILPENEIDLLFVSNTYHHLTERTRYFSNIKRYLRPTARVAIIEMDGRTWLTKLYGHITSSEQIRREMEKADYLFEKQYDFLSGQSFQVFSVTGKQKSRS